MKKIIGALLFLFTILITHSALADNTNGFANYLNNFTFDFYHKINSQNENTISSPYSVASLLGILAQGADGNTRAQLIQVLHLEKFNNINNIQTEFDKINTSDFLLANSLWAAQNFNYKSSFLDLLKKSNSNHFFTLDFSKDPEKSRQTINKWVEDNTKGKIQNLINKDEISNGTKLVLTNAIYFKGLWDSPFKKEYTEPKSFASLKGNIQVPMMEQTNDFMYSEDDKLQMLQLPYEKTNLAMLILLPKTKHTLNEIIETLNFSVMSQLLHKATNVQVHINLPRFKFESRFDSLDQVIKTLGVTDAFNPDKANFSNITTSPLIISKIIQKAVIEVDEKGTVAAAATSIIMPAGASIPMPSIEFNANHPFLFLIYDKSSELVLFIGQVVAP